MNLAVRLFLVSVLPLRYLALLANSRFFWMYQFVVPFDKRANKANGQSDAIELGNFDDV